MATPYMGLTLPIVSSTVGPDWAAQLVSAITLIDSHNHTSGQGTLIPTSAMNINADLSFNSLYNLTNARSVRFTNQGSPLGLGTDLGCIYESGGNLYWNSSAGSQVQITAGEALNGASLGAIGGDYATSTASLFYTSASKVFTFWQAASTPAKIDTGDILLRSITTPTNAITLFAPTSLASSYSLQFPGALPGSNLPLVSTSDGVMSFSSTVSQIDVTGNATVGGSLTLTGALVANGAVTLGDAAGDSIVINGTLNTLAASAATPANVIAAARTRATGTSVGVGGVAISNSATGSSSSSTYSDVASLTCTITTSGRPVFLSLIPGSGSDSNRLIIQKMDATSASSILGFVAIVRDSTTISSQSLRLTYPTDTSSTHSIEMPLGAVSFVDTVGAGTYVYKVQIRTQTNTGQEQISISGGAKLVAYEL